MKGRASVKIAVLSNVNADYIVRLLGKKIDVLQSEGYGNVLGALLNQTSVYNLYAPQVTFLLMDLLEAVNHETEYEPAQRIIEQWFVGLSDGISGERIYYISDAFIFGEEAPISISPLWKSRMEALWDDALLRFTGEHGNVRVFPLAELIQRLGTERAFSRSQWYAGKMPFSVQMQKLIADEILHKLEVEDRTPKKVLLLDLDGTLWGGVAGEHNITPVELSDDHEGLIYKNVQRMIQRMQRQGTILAIVSKNNESDVWPVLKDHPHMILRKEDFAAIRINWEQKHRNIISIAQELGLGTDSFVFWDDSPAERELVRQMLPEVTVPEFPERIEELPTAVYKMYRAYFERSYVTEEDINKTRQYAAQSQRTELRQQTKSFADYLRKLRIKITRVDEKKNLERLYQLVNKTNQFNLTTKRYMRQELAELLEDHATRIFAYRVEDCFGDYGITAVVIVSLRDEPLIEEFVMSCRIMGKQIENAVLAAVEKALQQEGCSSLTGVYIPTAKNKPVETLYANLGYRKLRESAGGEVYYQASLADVPEREYEAQLIGEMTADE